MQQIGGGPDNRTVADCIFNLSLPLLKIQFGAIEGNRPERDHGGVWAAVRK